MMELTIDKLVPLLTSPVWYKRLVGEYYELLIRCDGASGRIKYLKDVYQATPLTCIDAVTRLKKEIKLMTDQLYSMKQYEAILYRRLMMHGIQYVDILSEVLSASDALT